MSFIVGKHLSMFVSRGLFVPNLKLPIDNLVQFLHTKYLFGLERKVKVKKEGKKVESGMGYNL